MAHRVYISVHVCVCVCVCVCPSQYASINGTKYCVALPLFNPVAICYHKGEEDGGKGAE